jgi:hypothetical protein
MASSRPARYSAGVPFAEQEGAVELLDIDPAILNWFECVCVLQEPTGGLVRVGEGAVGGQFQNLSLTFSNAW